MGARLIRFPARFNLKLPAAIRADVSSLVDHFDSLRTSAAVLELEVPDRQRARQLAEAFEAAARDLRELR